MAAIPCISPETQGAVTRGQVPEAMGVFIKYRNKTPLERLGARWGRRKYEHFEFASADAMIENEVAMMKIARTVYPYVPEVINYQPATRKIFVQEVKGQLLKDYIAQTSDFSVLGKLRDAFKALHGTELSIVSEHLGVQGQRVEVKGYIRYYDFDPTNFMVDSARNVWILDFDEASLKEKTYIKNDDDELDILITDMLEIFTPNVINGTRL